MAPRESKNTPKVQRTILKNTTRKPIPVSTSIKKAMSTKKTIEQTPAKGKAPAVASNIKQNPMATPRAKESKPVTCPGSVTKSGKKLWKRRPKPAHSGVPVPEKMKRLMQQELDMNCSL